MDDDLRFPLGPFEFDGTIARSARQARIDRIEGAPAELRSAVAGLDDPRLDTPYREGGWTVRQVVHHVADSHLNAYTRCKLAVTESNPTIRPYEEARWAETDEALNAPVEVSLRLIDALHERWVLFLRSLEPADFTRALYHPERRATMTLDELLALYAWHGHHHAAHVTALRARRGWGPAR